MNIGKLKLKNNIFSAPMAGVTDLPFRLLAKEFGAGLVFSEMISVKGIIYNNSNTKELLEIDENEHPIGVQLFGHEPDEFAEAIKITAHLPIDLYDVNFGCPAPKIVKNGDGSALMNNPDLIGKIVYAMRAATDKPISAKIRLGFDKDNINAVEAAKIIEGNGADMVTVHGRTRCMYYSGNADWNMIRKVKKSVNIPVTGNGDVVDPISAKKMLDETGCDGVMIGRAAQGYPWIFGSVSHYLKTREILPEPKMTERVALALRHFEMLINLKGEFTAVREMRRHMQCYIKGVKGSAKIRTEIVHAETFEDMKRILMDIYNRSDFTQSSFDL
ncbi:MAG: tRNA dihydrouridine synthase DusB [Defluviitaleaceae bacterium]|nr:tRNA dihydrouridine synthase DusB [Defluviitaleaceae bacterium]